MSKKSLFLLILFLFVIGILLASRLIAGFDEGANNMVVQPLLSWFAGVHSAVVTHPWYVGNQFTWGIITSFVATVVFTLILWPKVQPKVSKPLTGLQDKLRTSTPVPIPDKPVAKTVATKTITPEEPKAETVVTEEAKT